MKVREDSKKVYRVAKDFKDTVDGTGAVIGDVKFFIIGIVVTLVSSILVLGGLATGIIVLLIFAGVSSPIAAISGLLLVGLIGFWTGVFLAKKAFRKIKKSTKEFSRNFDRRMNS